jgi:DNA-binding SARP family transcriptional activator
MSRLALYLLGPSRIELDGEEVHIGRRKALALLAYLAVAGQRHQRDSLATLLWSELDQRSARADLRRILSFLNRKLGRGWLTADRETAALDPDANLWLDVHQFRQLLAACDAHGHPATEVCSECVPPLEEAVRLYRDDFMAGFTLPDSLTFDEWQFFQTQGLRDGLAGVLQHLVRWHGDQGEYEAAIAYARRWLALDSLHEPTHRYLMALYAHSGQQSAALRQYHMCQQTLAEELGLSPAPETTALFERIHAGEVVGRVQHVTTRVPHNLPPQPTPFIGRESELADLEELIAKPSVRLITIIGAGGMGKTRLALAAAERFLDEKGPGQLFPNGVAFVDLTPLSAVDHVVPALAEALKFRFNSGAGETRTPREQILDYLRAKRTLLIMDNFEHLLAPPAEGIPTPPLTSPPREGKEERVASPAVGGWREGKHWLPIC